MANLDEAGEGRAGMSLAEWVDQVADRFEAAWRSGTRPTIEQYLAGTAETERAALLRELLLVDARFRCERGEQPTPEEYLRRFPAIAPELVARIITAASNPVSHCGGADKAIDAHPPRPADEPSQGSDGSEVLGMRIGPYKLLQKIGEGGFGTVYMAEQEQPVHRRVALKIIKPGMDSDQVLARFEAEREALAIMDHPNIAKVLDAGTTGAVSGQGPVASEQAVARSLTPNHYPLPTSPGRPFFVMELVKGVPITKFCDEQHLTPRERLELFIPVCQAVQHAHQKGVIHRDLKPANILVALYDGTPVPKVIDFGVAKALHQRLTDRTLFTHFGQVVGTFEYMSPEQAQLNQLDIDTRSDVYSLGVILYELLTGTRPFDSQRLRSAAFDEMLRIIREEEPQKPSTRLSSTAELPSIAAHRRLEPKKLTKLVRGELDWIVMKSLEKDRSRRYESAAGFARDIQRYLDHEPVQAAPPTLTYRLRKWVKRKPAVTAVIVLSFAMLVGLASTSSIIAVLLNLQRVAAEQSAAKERELREDAGRQRESAQLNYHQAREAVDNLTEFSEQRLRNKPGVQQIRLEMLGAALRYYESFADQERSDATLAADRAKTLYRVANLVEEIGTQEQALKAHQQALTAWEQLARERSVDANVQLMLATICSDLGNLLNNAEQIAAAEGYFDRAIETVQATFGAKPENIEVKFILAKTKGNLSNLYYDVGRIDEAETVRQEVLTLYQELVAARPEDGRFVGGLATANGNLGNVYAEKGRLSDAEAAHLRALEILKQAADDHPGILDRQADLMHGYSNLGAFYHTVSQPRKSEEFHQKAREIAQKLACENPDILEYQSELVMICYNLGLFYFHTGQLPKAEATLQESLHLAEKLTTDDPTRVSDSISLTKTLRVLGRLYRHLGETNKAGENFNRALQIANKLAARDAARRQVTLELAQCLQDCANLGRATGMTEQTIEFYTRAAKLMDDLTVRYPESRSYRAVLGRIYFGLATLYEELNRHDEAATTFDQAILIQEGIVRAYPNLAGYQRDLGATLINTGILQKHIGRLEQAEQAFVRALTIFKTLVDDQPEVPDYAENLRITWHNLASTYEATGRLQQAESGYREALSCARRLVTSHPSVAKFRQDLADSYASLGQFQQANGSPAASLESIDQAIELTQPSQRDDLRLLRALAVARLGDHAQATLEANDIALLQPESAERAYNAACVHSVASTSASNDSDLSDSKRARFAEQYASRAVELLRLACDKGFADSEHMKNDRDLDALRDRPDFQKLLAELEEKAKTQDE